jgi:hypothetical protein
MIRGRRDAVQANAPGSMPLSQQESGTALAVSTFQPFGRIR